MDFVRKIIESKKIESIISLPYKLKNKKVELLILPIEEKKEKKDFCPEEFNGVLNIDYNELEKELKALRQEWERI
jgi:hypothetical protein